MGSLPAQCEDIQSTHACSNSKGTTGQLSNWVYQVHSDQIPADIQTIVKSLILDGIACAVVGAKLPWSRLAVDSVASIEGTGNCTVVGWKKVT